MAEPSPTLSLRRADPARVLWTPNAGRQEAFVTTAADEALWGGEAGGGKSAALCAKPLRWCEHPRFKALILRRESSDLGKLLENADRLYPFAFPGAKLDRQTHIWTFPSGAIVRFNHCQHENDKFGYQGDEFNYVGWDELTHFTEGQYTEILTRLRTTEADLPCISRATANPGGTHSEWVLRRFRAWIDPAATITGLEARTSADGRALPPAREGEILHFERDGETGEKVVPERTDLSRSRVYFRSVRAECVQLAKGYEATLDGIADPVRRAQLKDGNWLRKAAPKDYWDRARVTSVDHPPAQVTARVRCWDFAASATGAWTVGTLMSIDAQGVVYIENVVRFRGPPAKVRAEFRRVSADDLRADPSIEQYIPQDPGQAGVDQVASYQSEFPAITIKGRRPTGDKLTRFSTASARHPTGRLVVVRGSWNGEMHDEFEAIPQNDYWDQADTVSDGFAVLTGITPADYDEQYDSDLPQTRC